VDASVRVQIVGLATFIWLIELNIDDVGLVIGMNRLRRGYVEMAPDLERYFVSGHHDVAGILRTYSTRPMTRLPGARFVSSVPLLVGTIEAVLIGALTRAWPAAAPPASAGPHSAGPADAQLERERQPLGLAPAARQPFQQE
jgi:hypothetical protein